MAQKQSKTADFPYVGVRVGLRAEGFQHENGTSIGILGFFTGFRIQGYYHSNANQMETRVQNGMTTGVM